MEVVVRSFFSIIFFILIALIEQTLDFYMFRWMVVLCINQLLILFSVQANPLYSMIIVAIVMNPLLDILQVKDLKRIDPLFKIKSKAVND